MRHLQVARLTFAITAVFVAAAVLFAGTRPGLVPVEQFDVEKQTASEGEVLFKSQCGRCHETRDIGDWGVRHPNRYERRAWLNDLLQRHFPPGEEARPLIIGHIEKVIDSRGRE